MDKLTKEGQQAKNDYLKEWREKNKDRISAYHKEWRKANRARIREYAVNYWNKKAKGSS